MKEFLLEAAICLSVMLLLYRFLLSKTSMHQLKRFYLLACLVVPLLIPLTSIDIVYGTTSPEVTAARDFMANSESPDFYYEELLPNTEAALPATTSEPLTKAEAPAEFDWNLVWIGLYALISIVLLARLLWNVKGIAGISRQAARVKAADHSVILLSPGASPFSFFKRVFIAEDDFENQRIRKPILKHELTHVREWHSLDLVLVELLRAVFWFNPLYWVLSQLIRANHEYIADANATESTEDKLNYQRLLLYISTRPKVNLSLVSPSDFSFIKKRLLMMKTHTCRKAAYSRLLFLAPVLLGSFFALAMNLKPEPLPLPLAQDTIPAQTQHNIKLPEHIPMGYPVDSVTNDYVSYTPFGLTGALYADTAMAPQVRENLGIDLSSKPGRGVIATAEGEVVKAETGDAHYGNYIRLKHGDEFETIYASLSKIFVAEGDQIALGQRIGTMGTSMNEPDRPALWHRVHYEVLKNGKHENPAKYIEFTKEDKLIQRLYIGAASSVSLAKTYELNSNHFIVEFDNTEYPFEKIAYDHETVLFFKRGEADPIERAVKSLSSKQWEAVRMFSMAPTKPWANPPTEDIAKDWLNPKIYGIWIDNKRVDNSVMSQYSIDDFAHHSKSRLLKTAKNYGKHAFQLNLDTKAKHEQDLQRYELRQKIWDKRARIAFNRLGDIE